MQHLDEGTIHAWLDGELSAEEAERAARHAAECTECGRLVAEARGVLAGASRIVSALDAGPAGVVPPIQRASQPTRRSWYRFALTPARMSIAATLLIAAGVTLTVQRSRLGRDDTLPSRAIDSQPSRSAMAPAADITDSIATAAPAPRATKSSAIASAQKTQNSAVAAAKSDALPTAVVGGAPGVNKKAASELKTRDEDAVERAPARVIANAPARAPAPAAAPAPVVAASAAARLDSGKAKDEAAKAVFSAGDRALQSAPERQKAASANQVPQGVTTATEREVSSTSATVSQDCYRLDIDSTAWRGALPSTFALAPVVSGRAASAGMVARQAAVAQLTSRVLSIAPGNAVYGVTAAGRVDSLVVGDWFQSAPSVVKVRFSAIAQRKAVTLILAANSPTARLVSLEGIDSVHVVRMPCAR